MFNGTRIVTWLAQPPVLDQYLLNGERNDVVVVVVTEVEVAKGAKGVGVDVAES